ncbi:MAG TPA: heavy metal translocating P-type ATPase [Ruminococcaceae bacterium]|nr:heavy metal translocating P-type ATPase [Oscillospiraceae bacterium]
MKEIFQIEGMSCAACSASVERAVSRLEGVSAVSVNLLGKTMVCEYDEKQLNAEAVITAVEKAGFSAQLRTPHTAQTAAQATSIVPKADRFPKMKTRLTVSGIFLALLMYVSTGHMLGAPLPALLCGVENGVSFAFLQFLLTLPILFVNRKFYDSGFRALLRRSPNMDSLVALGSCAAVLYGVAAVFCIGYGLGHQDLALAKHFVSNLYFESAAMILTLVTVGKFLEERSKRKTDTAIRKLMDLSPKTACVLRNGEEITLPTENIQLGDILVIRPGEKIPVDGLVTQGESQVDQSALTGESMPVSKGINDSVLSASVNLDGSFQMQATKVGKDTTLAQIIDLVEQASASKAPVSRLADRIAGIFVPIVMGISLLTFIGWLLANQEIGFALSNAICVLVISCPCALGLATPVAITVASGKSASNGILIKSAQALENMSKVNTVVFDKTGTLTTGKPSVTDIVPLGMDEKELVKIAVAAEEKSEHPLAKAVCELRREDKYIAIGFKAIPGKGVTAHIKGKAVYGGNSALMQEYGIDVSPLTDQADRLTQQGKTPLYFSFDGKPIGLLAVADSVRETSKETIQALTRLGIKTVLLSGDNPQTALYVADELGINEVISECLPSEKAEKIQALRQKGNFVAMVGDGINDSPALAQADIGIAMSGGTDIAMESADLVLMKNDPTDVVKAIRFSKRTLRNIKQNLFWAFFYNAIGIPVAAGLLYPLLGITLSPMIGAAAMSLSSLFVVTNAMRLYKSK